LTIYKHTSENQRDKEIQDLRTQLEQSKLQTQTMKEQMEQSKRQMMEWLILAILLENKPEWLQLIN